MMNSAHASPPAPLGLELRHFQLVASIVEAGSLAAASRRLHLTASALSHQLRSVEERLGRPLFQRRNRRLVLTATGARFNEHAQRVLAEHAAAEAALSRTREATDLLRISTGCYTCYGWLPRVLLRFRKTHPDVEVRIVLEATRYPVEALLAGQLDLGVAIDPKPHARLKREVLFGDELRLLVPASHPLARKAFVEPRDLASEELLSYDAPREELDVFTRFLWPAGVEPRRTHPVPLSEAIIELVRGGLGVAALSSRMLPRAMGGLASVRMTRAGIRREWCAVYRAGGAPGGPIPAFAQLMREDQG